MKFVEDPRIVMGTELGPDPKRVFALGMLARVMHGLPQSPSADIPTAFITEQRIPRVRVRGYRASVGGHFWISPGVMTFSLLEYARVWVRAVVRLRREPIPRAWVR